MVVCKYCQANYNNELIQGKLQQRRSRLLSSSSLLNTPDPELPRPMQKAGKLCKGHLSKCNLYLKTLKTPPGSISSQTQQVDSSGARGQQEPSSRSAAA
jgi:hypothetical protein